jgi:hypothetical protein
VRACAQIVAAAGLPLYWRAPYPGQPFRPNQFDANSNPIVVCTPSIKNGAARGGGGGGGGRALGLVLVLAAAVLGAAR